jgi:hypothetical protein
MLGASVTLELDECTFVPMGEGKSCSAFLPHHGHEQEILSHLPRIRRHMGLDGNELMSDTACLRVMLQGSRILSCEKTCMRRHILPGSLEGADLIQWLCRDFLLPSLEVARV